MMQRIINTVVPKTKLKAQTQDNDPVLQQFKCQRMVEEFTKTHLPESTHMVIIWIDKRGMMSSAYCNISPFNRMTLLFVTWLQELFDFKVKKDGKE